MAEAPRFQAYIGRALNRPVVHMLRTDWALIGASSTSAVNLDINATPLANVARDAIVVAAYARESSRGQGEIGVVRFDSTDAPNVYNTDKYDVLTDVPALENFDQIVTAASTHDNAKLREYLSTHVFLVKRDPDEEHQRPELPSVVQLLKQENAL